MKRKAFTITELLVAVGLLAAVIASSAIIFDYSVDAQQTAAATSEIMQNLRAITAQLNSDFAGLQTDCPAIIYFQDDGNDIDADSIVFFSTGDFQTYGIYDDDAPLRSHIARIYYGQAEEPAPLSADEDKYNKVLFRKQVVLVSDANSFLENNEYDVSDTTFQLEDYFAHYSNYDNPSDSNSWLSSENIDVNDLQNEQDKMSMFLARGVDDFKIEYAYNIDTNDTIEWLPDDSVALDRQPTSAYGGSITRFYKQIDKTSNPYVCPYPGLLRFSFVLYDSQHIFKEGRRFEYIIRVRK